LLALLAGLAAALAASATGPAAAGASSAALQQESGSFQLNYLPAQMRQLCQGDSATFTVWAHWVEPASDDDDVLAPLVPPGSMPAPAPLTIRKVHISAANGQVSPSEFTLIDPSAYFRFTYTAAGEGQDTITAVMDDGSASAEKTIMVLPACEYDVSFMILAQKIIDTGGYNVVYQGQGDFFVDRTAESTGALAGSGTDDVSLLMWAFAEQAFSCTMDKITASSTFKVEGMLNAEPYNYLHVNLRFDPLNLPSTMTWNCDAVGMGAGSITVPLGTGPASGSDLDMVGLTFPLQGGVEEVEVPDGFGYVIVTRR
jgi:hypothetical protein